MQIKVRLTLSYLFATILSNLDSNFEQKSCFQVKFNQTQNSNQSQLKIKRIIKTKRREQNKRTKRELIFLHLEK